MSVYARNLLAKSRGNAVDADLLEYILSAGMLGGLSGGNKQVARDLWGEYGPLLPAKNAQSFTLRLMISHLSMGQENLSNAVIFPVGTSRPLKKFSRGSS